MRTIASRAIGSKKKLCDKGLSEGLEGDRISELPDPLIFHILSFLSTKDAIRTSLLSTKWRNHWQLVLGLDLKSRDLSNIDEFVILVNKFFDFHRESWIHKLRLKFNAIGTKDYPSDLTTWVDAAATRRIKHLGLHCERIYEVALQIPLSLYTSKTLVHLRLVLVNLASAEFISLPCLKILYLEFVKYPNETTLDKLISSSPVLEDLTIINYNEDNAKVVHVRSQTLKRVYVHHWYEKQHDGLVIDAPLLQFLMFKAQSIKNTKFIINLGFTAKVDIDASLFSTSDPNDLSSRGMMRDFVTSISMVRCLVISYTTTEHIFHYLKIEPLHQFCYLSGLTTVCSISNLENLLILLNRCPKLESLSLRVVDNERSKKAEVMSSTVPPCLVSSLKFVKVEGPVLGCGTELKVASYFLENSKILEKLTLWNNYSEENVEHIRQTLHAVPRCSTTCEVVIFFS